MTSRISKASTLFFGVLGTLGVVAGGCGSSSEGRYYCDAAACYECDAYGCATVKPPVRLACAGTSSCPKGSVCTATGCSTTCSSDANCQRGEVCQDGLCAPPGTKPGVTKECTTKAECSAGQACNAGKCEACGGTAGPCSCTDTKECAAGQACLAGACTETKNTCQYSSECEAGKLCADGQCLTPCTDGVCSTGFTCDKGVCKPSATGGTPVCSGNAECTNPETPKCVSGSCVKSCTGDPECGAGKYCNQGACVVDTRPKPNCIGDEECGGTTATPKKCLGGFCKFTCTSDPYCRTIDSRIGYCAKDSVCRSAAEANATCTGPGQCPSGQSCIDNTCR